ncbi:hypothetical protein F5887DRAFT_996976 [Amanita rubescens]|nr:hypothetical protein F5887DRAFT_996976 [Amanita rubescens]
MILHVFQWLQLLAIIAPVSFAQDTGNVPNCTDDQYDWSPCYVADVLMTQCIGHPYSMVPLQRPGLAYVIPEAPSNPSCYCNSIWYSLISACAVCQNGTWLPWPEYILYCHSVVYLTVWVQFSAQDSTIKGNLQVSLSYPVKY